MTIETKLKELILKRYNSIREFTQEIDIPYSTIDSILRRGIGNSSITNVLKICEALGISADELANGRIIPIKSNKTLGSTEILDIINDTKTQLLHYDNLTLDGIPVTEETLLSIINALDVGIEMGKRYNKKG